MTQTAKGYSDHRWATYKQISEMGGQVRKGEKAKIVDHARGARCSATRPSR